MPQRNPSLEHPLKPNTATSQDAALCSETVSASPLVVLHLCFYTEQLFLAPTKRCLRSLPLPAPCS